MTWSEQAGGALGVVVVVVDAAVETANVEQTRTQSPRCVAGSGPWIRGMELCPLSCLDDRTL